MMQRIFLSLALWFTVIFPVVAHDDVARIDVTKFGDASFKIVYTFPRPIRGFIFETSEADLAAKGLVLKSDGFEYVDGTIRSRAAKEFSIVEFELHRPSMRLRQYDPVIAMTHGGAAVYTDTLLPRRADWEARFTLNPTAGEVALVRGALAGEASSWRQEGGLLESTYLYLGAIQPQKIRQTTYLLDPATPGWVADEVRETVNNISAFYGAQFGQSGRFKPMVFLSMEALGDSGTNFRGDTLPGQFVRLNLFGGGWIIKTEAKQNQLRRLIAHEIFHIWNAEFHRANDAKEIPWMHEGSAEYVALRSLALSGMATSQYVTDALNTAMNSCVSGAGQHPLATIAGSADAQQLFYDCGVVIFSLVDGATDASRKNDFSHWMSQFFNGDYSKTGLIGKLNTSARMKDIPALIENMEFGSTVSLGAQLRSMLDEKRMAYISSPFDRPAQSYSKMLLSSMLESDCKGGVGYWVMSNGVKIDSSMKCERLRDFPIVQKVMNQDIQLNPKLAYDAARAACASAAAEIRVTLETGSHVDIPCARTLPELLPHLYLTQLPWQP